MKRKVVMGIVAALCLGNGMTAFAAPETMPDGTVFDAEYYAQTYPDVVAALGTDAGAMYQHYVTFGRNEGRLAYDMAVPLPAEMEAIAQQPAEESKIIGIQGVPGQKYELPTWGEAESYYGGEVADKMINMSVRTTAPESDQVENDMGLLAPYTTQGYEWRPYFFIISGECTDQERWWANYYWFITVENSRDWNEQEEDAEYSKKFTVNWNGVDYTECKSAISMSTGQYGDVGVDEGIWLLLPKGYDGEVYLTINGAVLGETGVIKNEDAAVTFVY